MKGDTPPVLSPASIAGGVSPISEIPLANLNGNGAQYMLETNVKIPSLLGEEKKVIERLEKMLQLTVCSERDCMDIKTAAAEACLNAIEHGNSLNPDLSVNIHIIVTENSVVIEVCDHGKGAELQALTCNCTLNDGELRGWGLHFINKLVDDWEYFYKPEEELFCVRMNKYFNKGR